MHLICSCTGSKPSVHSQQSLAIQGVEHIHSTCFRWLVHDCVGKLRAVQLVAVERVQDFAKQGAITSVP